MGLLILTKAQASATYALLRATLTDRAGIQWTIGNAYNHTRVKLTELGVIVSMRGEGQDYREETYDDIHLFAIAYGVDIPPPAEPAPSPKLLLSVDQASMVLRAIGVGNSHGFCVSLSSACSGVTVAQYDDGSMTVEGPSRKPGPYPVRETYKSCAEFVAAYRGVKTKV